MRVWTMEGAIEMKGAGGFEGCRRNKQWAWGMVEESPVLFIQEEGEL